MMPRELIRCWPIDYSSSTANGRVLYQAALYSLQLSTKELTVFPSVLPPWAGTPHSPPQGCRVTRNEISRLCLSCFSSSRPLVPGASGPRITPGSHIDALRIEIPLGFFCDRGRHLLVIWTRAGPQVTDRARACLLAEKKSSQHNRQAMTSSSDIDLPSCR